MEAIKEINEKGTIQEQARELAELEKLYKRLYRETENRIYKNKLDNIRIEMCKINDRVQENMKVFDSFMQCGAIDVETFLNTFDMDWEEWDEEEDCYFNITGSSTDLGHCCRMALIHSEKLLKESFTY